MTNFQSKLDRIKAECHRALELSGKATPGPWDQSRYHYPDQFIVQRTGDSDNDSFPGCRSICRTEKGHINDTIFIVHFRTFSPAAAQSLLTAIEGFERGYRMSDYNPEKSNCLENLMVIADQWPEESP